LRTKAEKPFSLEKGPRSSDVNVFGLVGGKGKASRQPARGLLRDMLFGQKRVNLAEGTSIIGQRPAFYRRETARRGFGRARVVAGGFC